MEHYRCHPIFANKTRDDRVGDTVEFYPHHTNIIFISSVYQYVLVAADLTYALLHPKHGAPFSKIVKTQSKHSKPNLVHLQEWNRQQ